MQKTAKTLKNTYYETLFIQKVFTHNSWFMLVLNVVREVSAHI